MGLSNGYFCIKSFFTNRYIHIRVLDSFIWMKTLNYENSAHLWYILSKEFKVLYNITMMLESEC